MKVKKLNHILVRKKPHLELIEHSLCDIPKRLEKIDSDLFVCFNKVTQRYEIHSLANRSGTFCFTVPYDELDARVIEIYRRSSLKTRSIKEIVREIDLENEHLEQRNEKHRRSETNAWAREYRSEFKKVANELY